MMTEIPKLESDREEIDTRVVLYCSYAVDEELQLCLSQKSR